MSLSVICFYVLAVFILTTGLLAITSNKIFRSAIWLLFSLIGIAGLYFWLQVEFLAAVQIIVYAGGIVVLIIFSIFLTQHSGLKMPSATKRRILFSVFAAAAGLLLTYLLVSDYQFKSVHNADMDAGISNIGSQMLSVTEFGYSLPFEIVSILLLSAMIGCIVIAMKTPAPPENTQPKSEKS